MARARSCSCRACSGWPRSCRISGEVVQIVGDGGVVGPVGGLVYGQGAFWSGGPLRLVQVPQDRGEVVQAVGNGGVVGAVGGLGDGQGPFVQRPGLLALRPVPQYDGEVV